VPPQIIRRKLNRVMRNLSSDPETCRGDFTTEGAENTEVTEGGTEGVQGDDAGGKLCYAGAIFWL